MTIVNARRNFIVLLGLGVATGCGFDFEQKASFQFSSIYIQSNHAEIKEKLLFYFGKYPSLKIYTQAQDIPLASIVLDIVSYKLAKEITSKGITGRVLEYTLSLKCVLRVIDKAGIERIPETEFFLEEPFSYDIPYALAKEYEEQSLKEKIVQDLVDKIALRLLFL